MKIPNKTWVDNRPSTPQFQRLRFPTAAVPPHERSTESMTLKKLYYALRPMAALRANERFRVYPADMKKPRVIWGCLIPIVGILLLLFSGPILMEFQTSAGRKALPAEAANVEQYLNHGIIGGDFIRLLKASLPAERYADYARSLGLSAKFDPRVHQKLEPTLNMNPTLGIKIADAPSWWNPPEVDSTSYFAYKESEDHLRVLRYHNGSVYLMELSW